jgi:alkylhydroperoxidase family enzyme
MAVRLPVRRLQPDSYQALSTLHEEVTQAAAKAGLEPVLMELVKIRSSQLSGCAPSPAQDERLEALRGWRESSHLFTPREQGALGVTEALSTLGGPETAMRPGQDPLSTAHAIAAEVFTEQELSALVLGITVINAWNRLNAVTA